MPKSSEGALQNQLKEQRAKRGWTQEELASLVDVSRQTIIAIEKGQYNPTTALSLKLARVFETTIEEIFQLVDEP